MKENTEHLTPHKVHIRGVDDLTTDDIHTYSTEVFPLEPPLRIEWIDDTSANIVYSTPAIALKALKHLALNPNNDSSFSLKLQVAKPFLSYPESSLQVRIALFTDQKRPRAYEASRFYMMHPEHDPREVRRQDRSNRSSHHDYNRRRYSHEEHRRRRKLDLNQGFSSSMYDDDANALPNVPNRQSARRNSYSTHSSHSSFEERNTSSGRAVRSRRYVDSYRPGRLGRSSLSMRNRSASPSRSSNDRQGRLSPVRRRTPPPPYQTSDPFPIPGENHGKELFPPKPIHGIKGIGNERDLFPNKTSASHLKKELFPHKTSLSNHRRSDAFDAADETADLFANGLALGVPAKVGTSESSLDLTADLAKNRASTYGRLKSSDFKMDSSAMEEQEEAGLNIRGASKIQNPGFSIRGSAGNGTFVGTARELFPGKIAGNAGKELFAGRLEGRGAKRNRAEDMFN